MSNWQGNFRTWHAPQLYQNSVIDKVGISLYLFRVTDDSYSTYEDSNVLLSDGSRFDTFKYISEFKGFIDFTPTRKVLGKFSSVTWSAEPTGKFFLPDKSQLLVGYFPMTIDYSTYDYVLMRGEDAPHIGTTTLYRIVETTTEGVWTPLRMLVGLSVVSDSNLIDKLEGVL